MKRKHEDKTTKEEPPKKIPKLDKFTTSVLKDFNIEEIQECIIEIKRKEQEELIKKLVIAEKETIKSLEKYLDLLSELRKMQRYNRVLQEYTDTEEINNLLSQFVKKENLGVDYKIKTL